MSELQTLESRVLVLAPTLRDGEFTEKLFRDADINTKICRTVREICDETVLGAGMIVLAVEDIDDKEFLNLAEILKDQPAWSDLPVLLLYLQRPKRCSSQNNCVN